MSRRVTSDAWIAKHPYLRPVADVCAVVETAASRIPRRDLREPDWQAYLSEYHAGIPLLQSECVAIDVDPATLVRDMLDQLTATAMPAEIAEQCAALRADLTANPALFRWLLWGALAHDLGPVVAAFAGWRDEERWLRNYCPTCGSAPAMAQLAGRGEGRLRLLSCGCCGTRWRYRRTGCPFCEHADDHKLTIVAVTGEDGLRIDSCEWCHGYLKTYDGEGSEAVLLADWTSLHLDLLARDRGLKRLAASLYEV